MDESRRSGHAADEHGVSTATADTIQRVRRAADGDEDAFRELVRELYPSLRRWALAVTADSDEADEVVQRTLIRLHRGLPGFSGRSKLSTWTYRILARAAVDVARSRASGPDAVRPGADPTGAARASSAGSQEDPVRTLYAKRIAAEVGALLASLPRRQRQVLVLVDHEGRRPVEVAEMLGLRPVTVRANLFKARRTIRERILARHPELTEGYGP